MPLVLDMQEITSSVWDLFQDSSGKILDEYSVKKWTFYKGISPESRAEVWKFLLGYYPFLSTREQRLKIDREKQLEYERLLDSWQCGIISDTLADYIRVIGKDCVRTDRQHPCFRGTSPASCGNIDKLNRILTTWCVYNQDLGYVQGMNEFLAPIFLVMGSEHQSFWCLTEVLTRMNGVFADLSLSQPLSTLARLCYYADTRLHDHIKSIHGDEDWIFCYRAVLLNFKRELELDDIFTFWEKVWSNHMTRYFQLFVGVAFLVNYKREIMECKTIEGLMQFAMYFTCNANWPPMLAIATALVEQLKSDEYCPHELRYLVSDEGCAPPPLVGFVRARQKFSTLHSNKITRSNIWKSLFGDVSVQPITSPFLFSPGQQDHSANGHTMLESSQTTPIHAPPTRNGIEQKSHSNTAGIGPPPMLGFIPRNLFSKNSELEGASGCHGNRERSESYSSFPNIEPMTSPDCVHYNPLNGQLSGGVFDHVTSHDPGLKSHDAKTRTEFDELRSEPELLT